MREHEHCFRCNMVGMLLGVYVLAWIGVVKATTFVEQPFQNTVHDTALIVRGTVGGSNGRWATGVDNRQRLFTYTELKVSEVIKGEDPGAFLILREPGGEKNGITVEIPGAAKFTRGEDLVVMLGTRNPDQSYDLRGLMTGKFSIERDDDGTEYIRAANPLAQDPDAPASANQHPTKRWSLAELRKLVDDQSAAIHSGSTSNQAQLPSSIQSGKVTPRPSATSPVDASTSSGDHRDLGLRATFEPARISHSRIPQWILGIAALALLVEIGSRIKR